MIILWSNNYEQLQNLLILIDTHFIQNEIMEKK
jgi:hypothetical protein